MAQSNLHSDIQSGSVPFSLCITHCMGCFPACGGYSLTYVISSTCLPFSLYYLSLHLSHVPFSVLIAWSCSLEHLFWHFCQGSKGYSPLLMACKFYKTDLVKYLLRFPEVDPSLKTSVSFCCKYSVNSFSCAAWHTYQIGLQNYKNCKCVVLLFLRIKGQYDDRLWLLKKEINMVPLIENFPFPRDYELV